MYDHTAQFMTKHQERIKEADMWRLAAKLPRRSSGVRREVALACYRLANWLDNSNQYVRPLQSGPADWAV